MKSLFRTLPCSEGVHPLTYVPKWSINIQKSDKEEEKKRWKYICQLSLKEERGWSLEASRSYICPYSIWPKLIHMVTLGSLNSYVSWICMYNFGKMAAQILRITNHLCHYHCVRNWVRYWTSIKFIIYNNIMRNILPIDGINMKFLV